MNSTRPAHVLVSRGIFTANVIVNEYTQAFMIVTQERVCASFATDSQRFTRGSEWQRQHSNSLKCGCMFGQRSVVRDQRHIETQLQSYRTRIAKAASGYQRYVHTLFTCVI